MGGNDSFASPRPPARKRGKGKGAKTRRGLQARSGRRKATSGRPRPALGCQGAWGAVCVWGAVWRARQRRGMGAPSAHGLGLPAVLSWRRGNGQAAATASAVRVWVDAAGSKWVVTGRSLGYRVLLSCVCAWTPAWAHEERKKTTKVQSEGVEHFEPGFPAKLGRRVLAYVASVASRQKLETAPRRFAQKTLLGTGFFSLAFFHHAATFWGGCVLFCGRGFLDRSRALLSIPGP